VTKDAENGERRGPVRIGVDVGGTFSDFVVLHEDTGRLQVLKVPSTPADPSEAVLDGLRQLAAEGLELADVAFFAHGTTITTNALLEGKGARAALLITRGFDAVQDVQDQSRGSGPSIYDFFWERPPLLIPQARTGEIAERLGARGEVVLPLDEAAARQEIRRLAAAGSRTFAVCLLFSFMNPAHERRLRELIREEVPGVRVSLSSDVLPVIREWFRLSTTQVNAILVPELDRYLRSLEQRLELEGIRTPQRYVMQSNGGMTSFQQAAERAVTTVFSGPAAGVLAASRLAEAAGFPSVITFDMGGTSTDIALVEGGRPSETAQNSVAGYHIGVPTLDINTLSAGGGTIAFVDEVGTLRCGPHSAGADPGPVCYRKGGTRPTITDANLVLGYLSPTYFLGGRMQLDVDAAARAIETHIARPLALSVEEAAAGIVRLINVQMAQGVRAVSSERGYDLREFAIVAFGGAGPLHAAAIARELGIPKLLIPRHPGLTSALGLLMSDVKHDYGRSHLCALDGLEPGVLQGWLDELDRRALADLTREGFGPHRIYLQHEADLRYLGQGYEIRVPLGEGQLTRELLARARATFDDLHERFHGHRASTAPVELVSVWTIARARVPKIELRAQLAVDGATAEAALRGQRQAWFAGQGRVACRLYDRERLQPGATLVGPAIVEHLDSTTLVAAGQRLHADGYDNLVLSVGAELETAAIGAGAPGLRRT
jgi:N-methylhydantoinase A